MSLTEIQSLTERAAALTQAVDFWNTSVIWALILAAIAAAGAVVTTRMQVTRTKQLAEVQERLIRAKDGELALELKKKDEEIAKAHERAEAAKAEAAKANERILKMQKLRRLDKDKAEALTPLLKSDLFQKDPKPNLGIASVKDPEAQMYAMDFQRLLESCGVNIYPTENGLPNEVVQLEPNADGLMLRVRNKQNAPQAIVQFQRLVHSLGINIPVAEDASLRDHAAVLTILRKPD